MTSTGGSVPGDYEQGTFGKVSATAYRLLIVGVLLALAVSPTVLLLTVLDPSAGNVPLAALSAVFVGPALSAALFSLGDKARDDGLNPAAAFGRGYRLNALDVLKVWVPVLVVLAIILYTVVNINAAGVPVGWAGLLLGIGAIVLLIGVQATVIASFFAFRARDVTRLAVYFLGRLPKVTLKVLSALILAAALVWLTNEAVLALFGVLWAAFLLRVEKPLLAEIRLRFVE